MILTYHKIIESYKYIWSVICYKILQSVFLYGQLYVVVSRVTSKSGLKILVVDDDEPYKYHFKCSL
jgi:hypothetical protein